MFSAGRTRLLVVLGLIVLSSAVRPVVAGPLVAETDPLPPDQEQKTALPRGVYVADGWLDDEEVPRRAAVNLGVRPTFGGEEPRLEAHFPGFEGDLYGRSLRLILRGRLRDERRFDSLDDLKAQLGADVQAALRWPS